jgi:5-methylcytosine-specific restriction protein A
MSAYLITWRPDDEIKGRGWSERNIQKLVTRLRTSGTVKESWPFQSYVMAKKEKECRVFLVRQGGRGHALFGYGRVTRIPEPYKGKVDITFDELTVPSIAVLATGKELHEITRERKVWGARGSGIPLAPRVAAALENLVIGRKPIDAGAQADVPLAKNKIASARSASNDSMDDLPGVDYALLGSDGAKRIRQVTSGVKRDPKVRRAVLKRSKWSCERDGCGTERPYGGFLDVHHILGAERSDRVWNCVALCPNCHREAHAAPNRDRINAKLLKMASRYAF